MESPQIKKFYPDINSPFFNIFISINYHVEVDIEKLRKLGDNIFEISSLEALDKDIN
jgi:hypothetical protein